MWSKILPKDLRSSHSITQEGYAIVAAVEHWQFYMIKRHFIISTDNMPVAHLMSRKIKELKMQKQRQITRLLTRLAIFSFELDHVRV